MKGAGPLVRAPLRFPPGIEAVLRSRPEQIVVIGGGGWLGMVTLELLSNALRERFQERVRVFGSRERRLRLWTGEDVPCAGLETLGDLPRQPSLIFHFGFLTRDRVAEMALDAYVGANRAIAAAVAAAAERLPATGLVVPSSGAVYVKDRGLETDAEANPYGFLKVQDERRFGELAQRLRAPAVMPRVFNLSGPYINKVELYAIASIIRAILVDEPVTLRADRPVLRSYVDVADLIGLCVAVLLDQTAPSVTHFDTAGAEIVELGQLARRACETLSRMVEIRRPPLKVEAIPDRYVGDGAEMGKLARMHEVTLMSLDEQILSTAADLALRTA